MQILHQYFFLFFFIFFSLCNFSAEKELIFKLNSLIITFDKEINHGFNAGLNLVTGDKDVVATVINESNHELVIIDETSMIDTLLFDSLLKGLRNNIK